jgi:hypothetical protein
VFQSVHLEPGSYVLSWWDQARSADGVPLNEGQGPSSTLVVFVYSEDWTPVTSAFVNPYRPDGEPGASPWGPRRALQAVIPAAGTYHVAFAASLVSEARGSVAIANVQLEPGSAPDSQPGPYVATGSSRQYLSSVCESRSAQELQASFEYKCDAANQCFYELSRPLLIDTRHLGTQQSHLTGKLAAGNFNYRHVTLAINLVGTALHDCALSPTPSCFGSGYLEYTLSHDATNAEVINHTGSAQCFNFGSADINHGKGLAAERFITVPLSSADQGLLSQVGLEKSELRGRPLDGSYRLRIWDSPGLLWNRLEDIQLVLKYRYWSAIQTRLSPI